MQICFRRASAGSWENVYDDAAVSKVGETRIVVSTEGTVEDLVRDYPWLAGFYSVVVT